MKLEATWRSSIAGLTSLMLLLYGNHRESIGMLLIAIYFLLLAIAQCKLVRD